MAPIAALLLSACPQRPNPLYVGDEAEDSEDEGSDDEAETTDTTDTTTTGEPQTWCADVDGDQYGDPDVCVDVGPAEQPPEGHVANAQDCDDADPDAVVCVDLDATCVETTIGQLTPLAASVSGGDGQYTYQWQPASEFDDASMAATSLLPVAVPTALTLLVSDGLGNDASAQAHAHPHEQNILLEGTGCMRAGLGGAAVSGTTEGTEQCFGKGSATTFFCPWTYAGGEITLEIYANDETSNSFGFVWGGADLDEFYLFEWMGDGNDLALLGGLPDGNLAGCPRPQGISIKHVKRTDLAYTAEDFNCLAAGGNTTVVLAPANVYQGKWKADVHYFITLRATPEGTSITVLEQVSESETVQVVDFDVPGVAYVDGFFGTYANRQITCARWRSACPG